MDDIDDLLNTVYASQFRVSRDELYRRAVALAAPADFIAGLDALPDGEYTPEEVAGTLLAEDPPRA
jgi:hypothetical protein